MRVEPCAPGTAPLLVFSALDAAAADVIEPAFAQAGHIVVSNTRSFRMDPLVPLLVPEVNADHLALVAAQRRAKGWRGAIVTNPNCATVMLSMALAPLLSVRPALRTGDDDAGGVRCGISGVASLDILGNVIPHIAGEEPKIESETQKILGSLAGESVTPHPAVVSAQTTRVPVIDGHTEAVSVALDAKPAPDDLIAAFRAFRGRPQDLRLPTAPPSPIVCFDAPDRPQPRLDAGRDGGMAVSIGRVRPCPVLGAKFIVLGHNTIRGAAGAAVLNAELMRADGLLQGD